jgi:hypothetical protein
MHGAELEKKDDKGRHWLCKICYDSGTRKIMAADSTGSCSRHLNTAHGTYAPGAQPPTVGGTVDNYLESMHPMHAERWREDFINWIAHDDITFKQAASPWLRKVILGGTPSIERLLPCARTVRAWLLSTYNERITDVRSSLDSSRSRIHLSLDAWSSPNRLLLLGMVGHWIDEKRTIKTALLGLRPVEGHHGHEIADTLLQVITTFSIKSKLGAFEMDNATNNDTALEALALSIPGVDVPQQRLRCFG